MTEKETLLPCDTVGDVFLFNDKMAFLKPAKITENHAIELKEAPKGDWQKVGHLDASGQITPDKSLKAVELSVLKKTALIGHLQKNGDVLRCGTNHSARRLGFYAMTGNKHAILVDGLNENPPLNLGTIEGNF